MNEQQDQVVPAVSSQPGTMTPATTPSSQGEGNDAGQIPATPKSSDVTPAKPEATTPKPNDQGVQRNEEAERGKYASIESKNKEYENSFQTISRTLEANPKAFDAFRESYNELHPDSPLNDYEEVFGKPRPQAPSISNQAQPSNNQLTQGAKPLTEAEIRQIAADETQKNKERETALSEFWTLHPEMKPENVQDREQASKDFYDISLIAGPLKARNPGMTMGQALSKAYIAIKSDTIIKQEREQGEAVGRQSALNAFGTSSGQPAGGGATVQGGGGLPLHQMSEAQTDHYKKMQRRGDTKAAERYKKNIEQGLS